jgi:small subunit ribosomal protein S3Ae
LVKKKAKTKEWYTIISPKVFGEKEIGKTLATDPKLLMGRKIFLSAIELTDNINKYYMKFSFKVNKVEGNKAFTVFYGSECMQDFVSRMVVRRVKRIDTIQDLTTKDNANVRVKGIAVISRRAKSSIQVRISNKIKEILKQEIERITIDNFVEEILSDEIKMKVLSEARRIYPVRNFEIRKVEAPTSKEMVQKS